MNHESFWLHCWRVNTYLKWCSNALVILVIIGLDNGLAPEWHLDITWIDTDKIDT